MILQALKEYYDRKAADPESEIAPKGWERKEIPFIIVLAENGDPVGIDDTRETVGKKKRAKVFLVPQGVKRAVNVAANLLWDNPEYALGFVVKGKPDRVKKQHETFVESVESLMCNDKSIKALQAFLKMDDKVGLLEQFEPWAEIKETSPFISFRLAGDSEPVFRSSGVLMALTVKSMTSNSGRKKRCLVTGDADDIERLHSAIKGVRDANSTGGNIVGFNLDSFKSYGKEQGDNAPIGKRAAFAYTTALNTLLWKDASQKLQVGDATAVFWSDKQSKFESQVSLFFSEPPKDNPDQLVEAVKGLYRSIETGACSSEEGVTRFYVLGLSPNAARLSVRFWHCGTIGEMAGRFRQHFDDLLIEHGPNDRDQFSLWRLLIATATLGKSENIPPNLAGDTMRSILEGLPYPATLLPAVVRRIRAEHEITHVRAALLKACVNRKSRYINPTIKEELKVSLDTNNMNIGYRLGRLFAALEKIQTDAQGNPNATIRDRFYGAASGTPATVFGTLMRLKNHHLAKLHDGLRIMRERLLGEIMSGIADFPAHLKLEDQARFAIGYYHQMQDFYTKKEKQD